MKTTMLMAAIAGVVAGLAGVAAAGPVTPGNVLVYRVGNGVTGLTNTGNHVFIDEFTPAGSLVQSIALPAVGSGNKLIASGTATSEGMITVSPNGRWITVTGYNAAVGGSANLANSVGTTINRTVAVIDATTGAIDLSTSLTDFSSGNNPRSAVTNDGVNLWVAGGTGGVRYTTLGSSTSTQLTTLSNVRNVNIFNGQLYVTSSSTGGGNNASIGTVGVGLPTASTTLTALPGLAGVTGTSRFSYFFADLTSAVAGDDTLYIASDDAAALRKFSLVGGTWVANGTVGTDAEDYRGLTGVVLPTGGVQLFATRRGGSSAAGGGELVSLIDNSGHNGILSGTPSLLASAVTGTTANTSFRGVAIVIPTPGALALLGLGGLVAARRRR